MTTLLDVQGRRTVGYLVNKSGGAVVKGDAVIVDASNDEAFTTSAGGAEIVAVGIVAEDNGIANNASGRIVFSGYVDLVTVSAGVTRGHFGKTHTVAKQVVDAGASRVVGVFCEFLKGGTTPSAWLFGLPDGSTGSSGLTGGTPALTLGTSNSAGSASTGIRTDATIALFDATVPAALGTAAAGSAGVAARRDHVHPLSGLTLLEQHTAATSATLDFAAAISALYDEYLIELVNVVPASNAAVLWMRMSTDGGATYDTSAIYDYTSGFAYSGGTGVGSSATNSTKLLVIDAVSNSANYGICGQLRLSSPGSAALYKLVIGDVIRSDSAGLGLVRLSVVGSYKSATAVNAIRFLMDSGNIASGTIRVYGVAK